MTELRHALEHVVRTGTARSGDISLAQALLKKKTWNQAQQRHAQKIARSVGMNLVQENLRRRATLRENRIFCIGDFGDALNAVPGRTVSREGWSLPLNMYGVNVIRQNGFVLSSSLLEWAEKNKQKEPERLEEFDSRLFKYQREDVLRVEELNGKCLIGSEMGVGKTCIACTYIARHPELNLIIIIVPASLKLNWVKELKLWNVKKPIKIINGTRDRIPDSGIVIFSYNVIQSYYIQLDDMKPDLLVLDEAHYIKRVESQRTRCIKYLGGGIDKIIAISGTPITSRPKEFFTTLNLLNKQMFNSREKFLRRYCNSDRDSTGNGSSNSGELHNILTQSFMIRRLKKDILAQLPPKMYSVIPIQMEAEHVERYEFAKNEIVQYLKENYGKEVANRARFAETVVKMAHLRQLAVAGKIDESVEFVRNMVESGEKLVLFAIHKVVINRLMEEFGDIAVKIDGSVSQKQRQENVDRFQNDDKIKIFVGQIDSAGVGITLTASSNVVFFEYPFNPGQVSQAIDRCHRIGQEAESINVWYLVAESTIDSDIAKLLDKKAKVLADILDGGDLDEDILINQLIENLRNNG